MEREIVLGLNDLRYNGLSRKSALEEMNTKDLMKVLLSSLKEMKMSKKNLEAWCRKAIEELEEIGKTSKSIRQHCGFISSEKDLKENSIEDEIETSREIPVGPPKERKFQVLMDASNFKRGEVHVAALGKYLVIHAKHETMADDHGTISREFTRKFVIPEGVDIETLRSVIDVYGVLIVEASFEPLKIKEKVLPLLEEVSFQRKFRPYKDLKQFQELVEDHRKDGEELKNSALDLAEQRPSDCIPVEIV